MGAGEREIIHALNFSLAVYAANKVDGPRDLDRLGYPAFVEDPRAL